MDAQEVRKLIASSRGRGNWLHGSGAMFLALAVLAGALLADHRHAFLASGSLGWLVPQCAVILLLLFVAHGMRVQRRQSRLMLAAFEAVQLRQWERGGDLLRQLLARPVRHTAARTEALMALGSVLEHEQQHESAQLIYENILRERAGEPIQLHTAQVALAAVMLRNGHIPEAIALVDRLSRQNLPEPLRAQVELLVLYREVSMGHAAEFLDRADRRRELFRTHLGTKAAYGYALLAAAYDRANLIEQARAYWHDATLLVKPADLISRFGELKSVAARHPAAEFVL